MLNQSKETSYCHSRPDRESMFGSTWKVENNYNGSCQRVNGFRIKSGMTMESGRSMVEMLGVLAIMGVLSVGGISGYTTAMNKHKANEILNAAAVRAMEVSAQIQSGSTSPTLDEFPTGEVVGGATFDGVETIGDKFKIGFSLDNEDVLDQIKNIAGTDGIVRKITDDGLTYNDDLSTGERASDFDGDSTKCDSTKYTYCSATGTCITGASQTESCPENCAALYGENAIADDSEGNTRIGNTGCYCPAWTKFKGGECIAPFVTGLSACHYCAEGGDCWEYCSRYGGSLYSTASSPSKVCPDGYHWADFDEFFSLIGGKSKCSYDPEYNSFYDCTFPDALWEFIASNNAVWLKDCWSDAEGETGKGVACSADSDAWFVYSLGGTVLRTARSSVSVALCVL